MDDEQVGVLVVDDQDLFRETLRDLVSATPGMVLVGDAASGEAALTAVEELAPRMVIMDKRMPGMGGIEAAQLLTARHPELVVLLISIEEPDVELIRSCGAAAFLRKQELTTRALREVWATHGR